MGSNTIICSAAVSTCKTTGNEAFRRDVDDVEQWEKDVSDCSSALPDDGPVDPDDVLTYLQSRESSRVKSNTIICSAEVSTCKSTGNEVSRRDADDVEQWEKDVSDCSSALLDDCPVDPVMC